MGLGIHWDGFTRASGVLSVVAVIATFCLWLVRKISAAAAVVVTLVAVAGFAFVAAQFSGEDDASRGPRALHRNDKSPRDHSGPTSKPPQTPSTTLPVNQLLDTAKFTTDVEPSSYAWQWHYADPDGLKRHWQGTIGGREYPSIAWVENLGDPVHLAHAQLSLRAGSSCLRLVIGEPSFEVKDLGSPTLPRPTKGAAAIVSDVTVTVAGSASRTQPVSVASPWILDLRIDGALSVTVDASIPDTGLIGIGAAFVSESGC